MAMLAQKGCWHCVPAPLDWNAQLHITACLRHLHLSKASRIERCTSEAPLICDECATAVSNCGGKSGTRELPTWETSPLCMQVVARVQSGEIKNPYVQCWWSSRGGWWSRMPRMSGGNDWCRIGTGGESRHAQSA